MVRAPAGIRLSQATSRREFEVPADTPAVLRLDEPTAGIAPRETEAFGPLLRDIQAAFGCSMLVIEHDMRMVMSLSGRV